MNEKSKEDAQVRPEQQEPVKSPGARGRPKAEKTETKDELLERVYNLEQALVRLCHVAGGAHIAETYNIKRDK